MIIFLLILVGAFFVYKNHKNSSTSDETQIEEYTTDEIVSDNTKDIPIVETYHNYFYKEEVTLDGVFKVSGLTDENKYYLLSLFEPINIIPSANDTDNIEANKEDTLQVVIEDLNVLYFLKSNNAYNKKVKLVGTLSHTNPSHYAILYVKSADMLENTALTEKEMSYTGFLRNIHETEQDFYNLDSKMLKILEEGSSFIKTEDISDLLALSKKGIEEVQDYAKEYLEYNSDEELIDYDTDLNIVYEQIMRDVESVPELKNAISEAEKKWVDYKIAVMKSAKTILPEHEYKLLMSKVDKARYEYLHQLRLTLYSY